MTANLDNECKRIEAAHKTVDKERAELTKTVAELTDKAIGHRQEISDSRAAKPSSSDGSTSQHVSLLQQQLNDSRLKIKDLVSGAFIFSNYSLNQQRKT